MSEETDGVQGFAEEGVRARRRQYRITVRVLREYTSRLYRIAHVLGEYADGRVAPAKDGLVPNTVLTSANRYEAINKEISSLALYASQMLAQFDFDEAESAELRIRLFDAEEVVRIVGDILERLDTTGRYKVARRKVRPNSSLGTVSLPSRVNP